MDDYEARQVAGRLANYAAKVLIEAVDGVLPIYGKDGRRVSIMTRQHLLNKGLIETRWPGRVTSRGMRVRDILRQDETNG